MPVTPEGTFQLNLAALSGYHLFGSGCVEDFISGADGAPAISEGVIASGAPGLTAPRVKFAVPKLVKIFVPLPSLASAEPDEKLIGAMPGAVTGKVTLKIVPEAPVNPGFNTIPSKFAVPAELKEAGS